MTESVSAEANDSQQNASTPIRWAIDNSLKALKLLVEPRPLRALFRSSDDPTPTVEKPSPPTREEVLKFLIVRELLKLDSVEGPQDNGDDHEAICKREGSISVKAEDTLLHFSALLSVDDGGNGTAVPKYHMPISSVSPENSDSQDAQDNEESSHQQVLSHSKSKSLCDKRSSHWRGSSESVDDFEVLTSNGRDEAMQKQSSIDFDTEMMTSDRTSENASAELGFPDIENRSSACCDICFTDYEIGDKVAWSRNPLCIHAYHQACILDWLQQKTTCPICRHDYQFEGDVKEST
eukprot:Nitzschia sp. Nitz4//scaffold4_size323378//99174//100145//NITZ4_000645-RA/size323378-snap-gene-0.409-mRNA-1//1//CDS//3329553354//7584//frame0